MNQERAKSFVIAMIEAGCDICAVGSMGYVVVDTTEIDDHAAEARIETVSERFEDRDDYKKDIIDYLRKIGRVVEISKP